jgi:NADPH:quinone reductase-like Zn-dependent oxidoreductase
MGLYKSAREIVGYPITPGFEFAGRVAEVGPGAKHVHRQEEVFGVSLFGAYASQVVVPASHVFPCPKELTLAEAATFPTAFLTAWYAATRLAQVSSGIALVHSAAGGVGSALSQILNTSGCRVVGVVGSSDKVPTARGMGCSEVIDKSRENLWLRAQACAPGGFAAVFDANGVTTLRESYRHLAPMGRLVTYGFHSMLPRTAGRPNLLRLLIDYFRTPRFNPIRMAEANKSVLAFNLSFLMQESALLQEAMTELLLWLRQGRIHPLPLTEYSFDQAAQAHRAIQSGKTQGKLVLILQDE